MGRGYRYIWQSAILSGGGGTSPKRSAFFVLPVYERVGKFVVLVF